MHQVPAPVADFLACKRVAVAGVSRSGNAPANAIYRRLADAGHEVFAVNPNASEIEGKPCYPTLAAIPEQIEAVMVVTHTSDAPKVAQQALARNIRHIWFHRSFGDGSVSAEALQLCRSRGVEPIEGGCPLMYCHPVDPAHRAFRWWLRLMHRVPG
jgi:predicted CoA-binding protein